MYGSYTGGHRRPLGVVAHLCSHLCTFSKDIGKVLKESVELVHGAYGLGSVMGSLQVKYFNPVTSVALIRVSRDNYDVLWSAMCVTRRE